MYKNVDWPKWNRSNEEFIDVSSFQALRYFVIRDFERINGDLTIRKLIISLLLEPGFKYVFWLRITRFFWLKRKICILFFAITRFILKQYAYKYSFDISYRAKILPGFAIGHWGYIVIQADSIIGSNCFVRPGVVLGRKSIFDAGFQSIGDNVEFGTGAKCIGDLTIGNNVVVGANAVITHDVPDDCVVAGVPAKIIKYMK